MDSRVTQIVIGMTIIFGTIMLFLWNSAPRLISDVWHAGDFVPAQSQRITNYKCTNWNGVIVNHCKVTFVSPPSSETQQFTDWRFGPAPSDPVRLMQRRDDASWVTTDVSLRTLWNRMALALTLVLFGVFLAIALIMKAMKEAEAPAVAQEAETPARFGRMR